MLASQRTRGDRGHRAPRFRSDGGDRGKGARVGRAVDERGRRSSAADGGGATPRRGRTPAAGHRRHLAMRRFPGDGDGGAVDDAGAGPPGFSRECRRRQSRPDDGGDSVGQNNDGTFEDDRQHDDGTDASPRGCDRGHARRGESRARDDDSAKENRGGHRNARENYRRAAGGWSPAKGAARMTSRYPRGGHSYSCGDGTRSFREDAGSCVHGVDRHSTTRSSSRDWDYQEPHRDARTGEEEDYGRGGLDAAGRVDVDPSRRPRSFHFEDQHYYEADDEHLHAERAPMREISFVKNLNDDVENYQLTVETADGDSRYRLSGDVSPRDDDSSSDDAPEPQTSPKPSARPVPRSSESQDTIRRIELVMGGLFNYLDRKEEPVLRGYVSPQSATTEVESDTQDEAAKARAGAAKAHGDPRFCRSFGNMGQCRSFASLCLVLAFVHQLLLSKRTTTTREVYYVFVTHFRNQRECDAVILDVAKLLGVSRRSLGLSASPKGETRASMTPFVPYYMWAGLTKLI